MLYGSVLKGIQILVPFLMRTVMIYTLGIEYLGLSSLFVSVLQVLNLAELGIGSALIYSMYDPIARDDRPMICALLRLYRFYYWIIGGVVAVLGLLLLPFLPRLISGSVPGGLNLEMLYLMTLAATVLSYLLFADRVSLLTAYQRIDMSTRVTLLTDTVKFLLQLGVLLFIRNYVWFLMIAMLIQVANNLLTARAAVRLFPHLRPKGSLSVEMKRQIGGRVRDIFTSKLGAVIVNSADAIVISAFLGLKMLAVYQNYFFILSSVTGIVAVLFASTVAGIGNSLIVESKEKNFGDLKTFTLLISWVAGFCTCCLMWLYQPFLLLWVGAENMLPFSAVLCFCAYFFVYEINQLLNAYKDAAGIWHEDRFRPLVTAGANLIMNLILVRQAGIFGVLLSTVLSTLLIGMPWLLRNLFTNLFPRRLMNEFLGHLAFHVGVTAVACAATGAICSLFQLSPWWDLPVKALICVIIPNGFFFLACRKRYEFRRTIQLINVATKRRIGFIRRFAEAPEMSSAR